MMSSMILKDAAAIDLFSGVGGMSHGFQSEGYQVVAGYDLDPTCAHGFVSGHPGAEFHAGDVLSIPGKEIAAKFPAGKLKVLIACCPCQPFSMLTRGQRVESTTLDAFALQVKDIDADVIVMENVPSLQSFKDGESLRGILGSLHNCGYKVNAGVVNCLHYGVPQRRHRLVTIAARDAWVPLPERTHFPLWDDSSADGLLPVEGGKNDLSIGAAIGDLPPLELGQSDPHDPLHRAGGGGAETLARIKATPEGGSWLDWPPELREPRWRKKFGNTPSHLLGDVIVQVFVRPWWHKPSFTLTTVFYGAGNGPFMHPKQDRGFSIRERR